MEATEQIVIPQMSPAKQDRILIWRNEVATASLDDGTSSTANDNASSRHVGSSSATSTTTASSSSSSRPALILARGRQALAKVARRLSRRSWRSGKQAGEDDDGPTRTAMYARLSPDYRPDADEEVDGDIPPLRRPE
ncbi:hypothetical protein ISF_04421 [Cordyceps fumosorosea ARSEF 2679]|uniref:Uncharacterized protein n=1 Tax=Cordyceps fumosorosea (strain ARSEF 2679) TaxID=1081104 RepID=A0A167XIF8_CORFA|nr:hypothetical protein ISF_04421 [Cordyceps fumosorosea ARSEF 2679]OAA65011.1 hypothetical protein ISF_04421 [Cordyceps fumosorosea ARSEF 2679]